MSDPLAAVSKARKQKTEAEARLARAIRTARDEGCTLQAIATAAGVTRQRVWQIVARDA